MAEQETAVCPCPCHLDDRLPMNPWAAEVAREVEGIARRDWIDATTYGVIYGYSRDQAGHILRQAFRDGALNRRKVGRTFEYQAAGQADRPTDNDASASESEEAQPWE